MTQRSEVLRRRARRRMERRANLVRAVLWAVLAVGFLGSAVASGVGGDWLAAASQSAAALTVSLGGLYLLRGEDAWRWGAYIGAALTVALVLGHWML